MPQITITSSDEHGPARLSRHWTLSPSDLTFGWEDCRACFYHKIVHGLKPPRGIMPSIFNRIDLAMKECFRGSRIEDVVPELLGGVFAEADGRVESRPIAVPGRSSTVTLRGRFDTLVRLDDGSVGVLDFKTVTPKPAHCSLYGRQLHAYALALEQGVPGGIAYARVSRLGLLAFDPNRFVHRPDDGNVVRGYFGGGLTWVEIPRDDTGFLTFLGDVIDLLEAPMPPTSSRGCSYCQYRQAARDTGW